VTRDEFLRYLLVSRKGSVRADKGGGHTTITQLCDYTKCYLVKNGLQSLRHAYSGDLPWQWVTEDSYFYFNWVSDYVLTLRSSLNQSFGCHLFKKFFKETHVSGNCFEGDVPEWCLNLYEETGFLFFMTSCTFGCYMLCICFHSNAGRVDWGSCD